MQLSSANAKVTTSVCGAEERLIGLGILLHFKSLICA
jgi:hypothetical protein